MKNAKQQQLTYSKGITNVPSDAMCDDNELSECLNMVHDGAELRPVQEPVQELEVDTHKGVSIKEVLFIHKLNNEQRYIVQLDDNSIAWGRRSANGYSYDGVAILMTNAVAKQVQAIGKTLIITSEETLYSFLWDGKGYTPLGSDIPEPELIEFETYSREPVTVDWGNGGWRYDGSDKTLRCNADTQENAEAAQWVIDAYHGPGYNVIEEGMSYDYLNYVTGLRSSIKNQMHSEGVFTDPFMVRFAVEMIDGTYRKISAPIMMFPTVHHNHFMQIWKHPTTQQFHTSLLYYKGGVLRFKAKYDYSELKDLVKGISVFVSRMVPIDYYDESQESKKPILSPIVQTGGFPDYISEGEYKKMEYFPDGMDIESPSGSCRSLVGTTNYQVFHYHSEEWIKEELLKQENFYKLADLGLKCDTNGAFVEVKIPENRLRDENIVQATKLDDNLYERHGKGASSIFAYNNRLIVGALRQILFKGDKLFIGYKNDEKNEYDYDIYVDVKSTNGTRTVHSTLRTSQQLQYFYYYPDPRAYHVRIYRAEKLIVDQELKESEVWHGSYFFAGLPEGVKELEDTASRPEGYDESDIILDNQISVSEVNNPWQFTEEGMLTAGTGEIIGFSTYTTALSQGQFGQFPLLIFTTEGIYAASMNDEGVFIAVHPMSREVCNNPASITQTDGAVFFSSEKGLMMAVGDKVTCVSEQLSGHFPTFLKNARIAYDYRDSLLWIMQMGTHRNYVYNIKTGTFHSGDMFYKLDESATAGTTGTTGRRSRLRAMAFEESQYPRFTGIVLLPENTAKDGMFDDAAKTALKKEVFNAEKAKARIVSSDSTETFVANVEKKAIYKKWDCKYSVDGVDFLGTQRYQEIEKLTETGGEVYKNEGVFHQWTGTTWSQLTSGVCFFGSTKIAGIIRSNKVLDKKFKRGDLLADLQAIEEEIHTVLDASILEEELVFVSNMDDETYRKQFLLRVYVSYTYSYSTESGEKTFTWSILIYYTSWDEVSGKYSSSEQLATGIVFIDKYDYVYTKDNDGYLRQTGYYYKELASINETIDNSDIKALWQPEVWLNEELAKWRDETDFETYFDDVINKWAVVEDVIFDSTLQTFLWRVSYSYSGLYEKSSGAAYYKEWTEQGNYITDGHPIEGKIYLSDYVYYKAHYNETEGKWELVFISSSLTSIVNDYPDTLFFKQGDGLYSLLDRPQPEDDETDNYEGVIETRPMKLENALALKSIMQLKNIYSMQENASVTLKIFASNDLKNWKQNTSLRGLPWKYYKFHFDFKNMKATDRFTGTVLITQERRTNKLR